LIITSLFSGTINTIGQYRGFMPFEPVIYYLSLIIALNSCAQKSKDYNFLSNLKKIKWMIIVPLIAPFLILINKNYFNLPFHAWDIMHMPIFSYLHNENKINIITWFYTIIFLFIYIFTFIQNNLIKIIISLILMSFLNIDVTLQGNYSSRGGRENYASTENKHYEYSNNLKLIFTLLKFLKNNLLIKLKK
jgi:hypothetical protein